RTDANQAAPTGRDAPRGRQAAPAPQPQAPQSNGNPLESLSLDIGRLMDRNLATEMWDRYQRGENKAFTKRLYTPAGQKAFDEVRSEERRVGKEGRSRWVGGAERNNSRTRRRCSRVSRQTTP